MENQQEKKDYIIYEIRCNTSDCTDVYVGSTCNMPNRKKEHRTNSKTLNNKLYQTIREHGGWKNWKIHEIKIVCDITRQEAHILEEAHRIEINATLNMIRAFLTVTERLEIQSDYITTYRLEHKEQISEQRKAYRLSHKEQIREQCKAYRLEHKEQHKKQLICTCGGKFIRPHKARHEESKMHQAYIKQKQNIL